MEEKLGENIYYADLLGLSKIKLFEFGRVFKNGREFMAFSIGIAYKKAMEGERVNDEVKEIRDALFAHLGGKVEILCTVDDTGGIISKGGKQIGMTNNRDGIMEVDFDALISDLPEPKIEKLNLSESGNLYKPFSPYPFIVRDVAVFVPNEIPKEALVEIIEKNAGELMVRNELFDVFEKGDKTSYAFRIVFQSFEKTLTDEETNRIMDKIYEALKTKGGEIR
jgi:phenylalanyl-tRNA synthetase beta subunit